MKRTISMILTLAMLISYMMVINVSAACSHGSYTDYYSGTSYTGNYNSRNHELCTYYDRTCKYCGKVVERVGVLEYEDHDMRNGLCRNCDYEEESCSHPSYEPVYKKSKYTGVSTETEHSVIHYYDKICDSCGEKIGTEKEQAWGNHKYSRNGVCDCGHKKNSYKEPDIEVAIADVFASRRGFVQIHVLANEVVEKIKITIKNGNSFTDSITVEDCEAWLETTVPKTADYTIKVVATSKDGKTKKVTEKQEIVKYDIIQEVFEDMAEETELGYEIQDGMLTAIFENIVVKPYVSFANALDTLLNYPNVREANVRIQNRSQYISEINEYMEMALPYGADYFYAGEALGDVASIGIDCYLVINGVKTLVTGVKTIANGLRVFTVQVLNATTGCYENICITVNTGEIVAGVASVAQSTTSFAVVVSSGSPSSDWKDVEKEPEEDVDEPGDSRKLAANMEKAGRHRPRNYRTAAHHIVASNSKYAADSRDILKRFGISLNNEANGVFLPIEKGTTGGTYHPSMHGEKYHQKVYNLLFDATSREQAIEILIDIANQLKSGTF